MEGKPETESDSNQRKKLKKERGEQNRIERKFGQGKNKYKLNKVLVKLTNLGKLGGSHLLCDKYSKVIQ